MENFKQKVVVVGKVVQDFNPGTREGGGRGKWILSFDASMVYMLSYRTAKATKTLFPKTNNNSNNDDALLT